MVNFSYKGTIVDIGGKFWIDGDRVLELYGEDLFNSIVNASSSKDLMYYRSKVYINRKFVDKFVAG